jgi:hypothetical protein
METTNPPLLLIPKLVENSETWIGVDDVELTAWGDGDNAGDGRGSGIGIGEGYGYVRTGDGEGTAKIIYFIEQH